MALAAAACSGDTSDQTANGAPDWAVFTDGLEFVGAPNDGPWYLAATDRSTQSAYQNFWDPERGHPELQEHYWRAWPHVVERFADHPAVTGYNLMNEPAPATARPAWCTPGTSTSSRPTTASGTRPTVRT